ncbi:MAG: phenylalanine--tRNA ligase subunit alpha, partial [Anaerovoracaceae bacterium]
MQEQISKILQDAKAQIQNSAALKEVEEARITILGKKGKLTEIFKTMGKLSKEEKKEVGPAANKARNEIESLINEKFEELKAVAKQAQFKLEKIDVTEPGEAFTIGVKHPLTITIEELSTIFT